MATFGDKGRTEGAQLTELTKRTRNRMTPEEREHAVAKAARVSAMLEREAREKELARFKDFQDQRDQS